MWHSVIGLFEDYKHTSHNFPTIVIFSTNVITAWLLEWHSLILNCLSYWTSCKSKKSMMWYEIIFSKTLDKKGSTEIGMKFWISWGSPSLKIGMTFANFHSSGKYGWAIEMLIMCVSRVIYLLLHNWTSNTVITRRAKLGQIQWGLQRAIQDSTKGGLQYFFLLFTR